MGDRYVFHTDNNPEAEDWPRALDAAEQQKQAIERNTGHEDTPLWLTRAQKSRLWCLLEHELGQQRAYGLLKRIEAEV